MGVRLSEECNWRVGEGEDDEGEREESSQRGESDEGMVGEKANNKMSARVCLCLWLCTRD